jgi:SNF2 family DNA or RNA helicase
MRVSSGISASSTIGKVRGTRMDRKDELRAILKPYVLRRLKKDVLPELGEIDVQHWYVKPDAQYATAALHAEEIGAAGRQEAELRRQIKDKSPEDLLAFLAGDQEFATLRRYNALLKAPAVFEQVMFEMDNGLLDKVVIFGYHKEALAVLHKKFNAAGVGAVLIYGDTEARERDALVESWKRKDGPRVNLSSVEVAGTVLDYTAAHQVIALEMVWVPGTNWQAWQRPHRQGQTQPVTVRVAMGSEIDEIVNDVVLRKTKEIAAIFD